MNKDHLSVYSASLQAFQRCCVGRCYKGYETHLLEGGRVVVTLAGAMSTASDWKHITGEMIRQGKIDIISCTGANLEEDVMNYK